MEIKHDLKLAVLIDADNVPSSNLGKAESEGFAFYFNHFYKQKSQKSFQ